MNTIAIVITSFNRIHYLPDTLQSCLSQTLPGHWKFFTVVVDDGSTDGTTKRLIDHFHLKQTKDKGIYSGGGLTVMQTENTERGAARNCGAQYGIHSGADWLLFLDSDDFLAPQSLDHFVRRMEETKKIEEKAVAIFSNCILWYGDNRFGAEKFPRPPLQGDLRNAVISQPTLTIGTTLVSSETFQKAGGFSDNRKMSGSEDWDFWCRLSFLGSIYYSDHISLWYRRHEGSTQGRQYELSIHEAMKSMEKTLTVQWQEKRYDPIQKLRLYGAYLLCGTFNSEKNLSQAWKYWREALRLNPWGALSYRHWRYALAIFKNCLKNRFF